MIDVVARLERISGTIGRVLLVGASLDEYPPVIRRVPTANSGGVEAPAVLAAAKDRKIRVVIGGVAAACGNDLTVLASMLVCPPM